MKLFVLGATGATGGLFVTEALQAGHAVHAVVRSPEKIAAQPGLTAARGDVHDATSLADAMRGSDAVVSLLGLDSGKPNGFSHKALTAITEAADLAGVARVVILSAFGVGESGAKASLPAKLMYATGAKAIYADKAAGEAVLTASELDWTLVYPVMLTSGERSPQFQAIDLAEIDRLPGLPRVSRADVAAFMVAAIAERGWSCRTAVLTTGRGR